MIGTKVTLWRTEYRKAAYKDQFGISQSGYVVLEEVTVVIVETKSVPAMWGAGTHEGWKATSQDGREFFCNWDSFPDDSLTPTYFWTDQVERWVDAEQAFNYRYPHVHPSGEKAVPTGFSLCQKHNRAFPPDEECFYCRSRQGR